MPDYLSVSHLTKYLKLKFDRDPYLEKVYLTGQVSNFRKRPTHQYFSLKDETAVIQATIWAGVYKSLGFDLEEGMKVNVVGRVQLYEPGGSYSIIIERAEPDGIGALAIQFEQLKKKLGDEGLFQDKFKQPLPQFAQKIGVVTSPSGAVIRDIITTVSRRFPGREVVLYPTKVQGEGAAAEIAQTIQRANERKDLDVLIVGRGGGSIEDLWAFNEEELVRAVFESRIPIISSVGHETDTTLVDFVADRRAATPTAAAELATPVTKLDVLTHLKQQENRMNKAVGSRLKYDRERLEKLIHSVIFRQPERLYDAYVQKIDQLQLRLKQSISEYRNEGQKRSQVLAQRLLACSPMQRLLLYQEKLGQQQRLLQSSMTAMLDYQKAEVKRLSESLLLLDTHRIVARGYAIVKQDEHVIDSIHKVQTKENVTIQLRDGHLEVEIKDVKAKEI